MGHCAVLPGLYGILVQGILFAFSVVVLGLKFCRDKSGRTLRQFVLDSSKQMAGAGWTHVLNLACAWARTAGDQCAVYWIEIMIDTTLGVAVEFYLLQLLLLTVRSTFGPTVARKCASGKYFDESGSFLIGSYSLQLGAWLLVVSGMKICMVLLMVLGAPVLQPVALLVLSPVLAKPELKLLVVMILTPGIMNAVQFWLVDNIFVHAQEASDSKADYSPTPTSGADAEFGLPSAVSLEQGAGSPMLLRSEGPSTKASR